MSSEKWVATSVLEFGDRYVGQVLHVGTREECDKTVRLIDAITYSGDETVLSSKVLTVPQAQLGLDVGAFWRCQK